VESVSRDTIAIFCGLGIGAVVGAAALVSNFCALGALADILFARDWRRMRAWILAAGVALLGTQALDAGGIIHIDHILGPGILWLAVLVGGVCFGFGMALSGGCVNRALVRVGAGSLKSLVIVLVVGSTSALTVRVAPLNGWGGLDVMVAPEALHRIMGAVPIFDADLARWLITTVVAGGLIIFALKDSWFRASRDQVFAGAIIGAMIPAAWVTDAPKALNFVAPVGDLLILPLTHTATSAFAIAAVVGVPLGSFVAALTTRNLAREVFTDLTDTIRNLIGASLMGFGGTLALGCTFGQGLSGFSTLSITAMIAVASMIFGCLWGIRMFEAESVWGGLKLIFKRGV
jgi:uncharacterized protein